MLKRIHKLQKSYTIREYSQSLIDLRKNDSLNLPDKLTLLNNESIKMIATQKRLYS